MPSPAETADARWQTRLRRRDEASLRPQLEPFPPDEEASVEAAGARTGLLFACGGEGVVPDLMCLGKGLTEGTGTAGLAARFALPVLAVARGAPGTLDHAFLAAARERGWRACPASSSAAGATIPKAWPERPTRP